MLSLFKNKTKTTSAAGNIASDRMAKNIVVWCIKQQQRWAAFMQRRMERLSGKGKLIALLLFCLIAGSLSIYLIASSLIGKPFVSISVSHIKTPLHTNRSGDENTRSGIVVSKQEYQRIERFRHYMDSLARSPSGRPLYDSILKQRRGLMDSVAFIENLYQSQTK